MIRSLTLILAAWIISSAALSQIPVWTETYGSGSMNLNIYSSELGPDEKFLISGSLWGTVTQAQNYQLGDASINIAPTPYSGSWHYGFYAKLDSNGVMSNVQLASPPHNEQYVSTVYTMAASQDAAGNIYSGGRTHRNTNIYGNQIGSLPGGNQDAYISKNAPDGSPIWIKVFGGNVIDEVQSIEISNSGRIYITGNFRNTCDFGTIQKTTTDGWSDGFIAEINENGDFLWVKVIGGTDFNTTPELEIDSDGNLYSATRFTQNYELEDGTSFTAPHATPGILTIKMDADGNTLWTNHCFGSSLNGGMDAIEMKIAEDGKVWLGLQHGNTFTTQEGVDYYRPHIANGTCLILDPDGSTYNVIAPETTSNSWFTGLGSAMEGMMMPGFTFENEITIGSTQIVDNGTHTLFPVIDPDGNIDGYGVGDRLSGESYQAFHGESLYIITRLFGGNNAIQGMSFTGGYDIGMAKIIGNNEPELLAETQIYQECADATEFIIPFTVEDEEHTTFDFRIETESGMINSESLNIEAGTEEGEFLAHLEIQDSNSEQATITLIANDGYGEGEISFELEILGLPELIIADEVEICPGEAFLQSAMSNASVQWNNGVDNGTTWYPEQSMLLTATAMDENGCFVNADMDLTVFPSAHLEELSDIEVCNGESLTLTADSDEASIEWSNGIENGASYSPMFTEELTVTATSIYGCETTESIQIFVRPLPEINLEDDISVCAGEEVILNAAHNGNSGNWTPAVENGVSFIPSESESYTFEAVNEFNCVTSGEVFVEVLERPIIAPINDMDICEGESIVLSTSHTGISGAWNNDFEENDELFPADGDTFSFIANAANGCSSEESFTVNVHSLPIIVLPEDQELCIGEQLLLNASADGASINWSGGFENNETITVSQNLSLTVTAVNTIGCEGMQQLNITAIQLPLVDAGPDQSICDGQSITLNGSGEGTLSWSVDAENGMDFTPEEDMTLVLTASSVEGCIAQDEVSIDWNENPSPQLSFIDAMLIASGGSDYQWYLNGEIIPDHTSSSLEPQEDGEYQVLVYNEAGCEALSEVVSVTVTGIHNLQHKNEVLLYPNPAESFVFVEKQVEGIVNMEVFTAEGRLVNSIVLNNKRTRIDLFDLSPGLYLLKLAEKTHPLMVN